MQEHCKGDNIIMNFFDEENEFENLDKKISKKESFSP